MAANIATPEPMGVYYDDRFVEAINRRMAAGAASHPHPWLPGRPAPYAPGEVFAKIHRHLAALYDGDTSEDHWAALACNAMFGWLLKLPLNEDASPEQAGPWMQTASGRRMFMLAAGGKTDTMQISIEDIAHALGMQCRFNGHVREFYSVAQHSVLASKLAPADCRLYALLHDAAEAYMGDVISPVKLNFPGFQYAEGALERRILEALGVPPPTDEQRAAVKTVDLRLCRTEAEQLLGPLLPGWLEAEGLPIEITPWNPVVARKQFLARYGELRKEHGNGRV